MVVVGAMCEGAVMEVVCGKSWWLSSGAPSLFLEKKNKQHDHDDVDDWLYQADCHAMPVLHADCITNDGGVWRYEDPFASDVMPMM